MTLPGCRSALLGILGGCFRAGRPPKGENPVVGKKKRRTTRFGRELARSVQQAIDYLDGKLACQVYVYDRARDIREAAGLTPSEMAERLGMDLEAYLAWENELVEVVNEVQFRQPPLPESPSERLGRLIAVRAKGER